MKFQYLIHKFPLPDPNLVNEFNNAGAQGWELVNFTMEGEAAMIAIFKKQVS
jgi:hypothetical protein